MSKDEIFRESYEQRMREQRDYISGIYSMNIKLKQKNREIEEKNRVIEERDRVIEANNKELKKKILFKIYF